MGKIVHQSGNKLLRYGDFTDSISKSFSNHYSYIKQTFNGYTYDLLHVRGGDSAGDSINRTSYMSYENMNATLYSGSYNLKLHSTEDYWGNGTMKQSSNYLVKKENVIPYTSSLQYAVVGVYIPNTLIRAFLNTSIYFFVTLDNSILGYNGRAPVGADFPRDSEIYPYNPMATDYILSYKFDTVNDRGRSLTIYTEVPAARDCYANVFIFIKNRNNIACSIDYNTSSTWSYQVDTNFLPTQVLRYIDGPGNPPDTIMTGTGYSLYVDGEIMRDGHDNYAGEAVITFKNIS